MPPTPKKETGTKVADDEKAAQDIATHADRPSGTKVYRWIGNYAQEFVGPNDTTPFVAPGDYVELDLAAHDLAGEYYDNGLLIEAPGQEPGPAPQDEGVAAAEAEATAETDESESTSKK